ncbi:MAG: hypothetical protein ABSB15_09010 [Bryobacteraceae bacterium]|jgi:hypothetical protein
MSADWVFEPFVQTSLLGAGLIASSALWIFTKFEARAAQKTFEAFRLSTEAALRDLAAGIEEIRTAPADQPSPSPLLSVHGMNLTTRAKALRMHHRGETVPGIAAALGVQQEEVELLLKLSRLLEGSVA